MAFAWRLRRRRAGRDTATGFSWSRRRAGAA